MTISEKNDLLDSLSICYNRVNYLKVLAEEKNDSDTASQLDRRKSRLKTEIDGLLQDLYADWIGDAASLKNNIDDNNKKLNDCIADIEKDITIADNIVKAVGYVDQVITLAAGLVK